MIDYFAIDYKYAFIHTQLDWLGLGATFSDLKLIKEVILDSEKQVLVQVIERLIGTKILQEDQEMLKKLITSEAFHVDRSLLQGAKRMHPQTFNSIMQKSLKLP